MKRKGFTHWLRAGTGAFAVASVAAGCASDDGADPLGGTPPRPNLNLAVEVSAEHAEPGERIAVALSADAVDKLLGVQGTLTFDARRLQYLGQGPQGGTTLAMVNADSAANGKLMYLVVDSKAGLGDHIGPLMFEVRDADYASSLRYSLSSAVLRGEVEVKEAGIAPQAIVAPELRVAEETRRFSVAEWAEIIDPVGVKAELRSGAKGSINFSAGQRVANGKYGDVNLRGGFNGLDVAIMANASLGQAGFAIIVGTDSVSPCPTNQLDPKCRDFAIAANVRPVSPVIGGADPGRVINVLDVQAAQATFLNAGVDIAGVVNTVIRQADNPSCTNLVVSGTITGNVTWNVPRPCYVQLDGLVRVGDEALGAAGEATLTIAQNTLIKGNSAINPSALFVTRNGRLIAIGTPAEPIEFSCTGTQAPACWGGVFIAGNATINEQQGGGLAPSPAIPGRQTGGANQRQGEGGAPAIGGNNDADSSGVLRYVRIEYAGFTIAPNNELNCLTLGAVGYGTDVDHVQCHKGSDDGFEMFGGTVDMRYMIATDNEDDAFDISFGYNGRAQFVLATVPSGSDSRGIEADNTETLATFGNTPATSPELYNFTLIGTATSSAGLQIRRGTSPEMGHFFVTGFPRGMDIDDDATCLRPRQTVNGIFTQAHEGIGDSLTVRRSRFAMQGGTVGDNDTDPTICNGYTSPNVERDLIANTAFQNDTTPATAADLLINPMPVAGGANIGDYRPKSGLLAAPAGSTLPSARTNHINFDAAGQSIIGALTATPVTGNTLPWYAGWTRQP